MQRVQDFKIPKENKFHLEISKNATILGVHKQSLLVLADPTEKVNHFHFQIFEGDFDIEARNLKYIGTLDDGRHLFQLITDSFLW